MKQFPTHIVAVDGIVENDKGEILLVRQRNKGYGQYPVVRWKSVKTSSTL